jgi:hypothetical protein
MVSLAQVAKVAALPFTFNRRRPEDKPIVTAPDGAPTDMPESYAPRADGMKGIVQQFMALPKNNAASVAANVPGVDQPARPAPTTLANVSPTGPHGRPMMDLTGDAQADRTKYQHDLRSYRNPKGENRWWSGVKEAGRDAMQGWFAGGLPGAVRGATGGFAYGLAVPNVGERRWRDQELARLGEEGMQDANQAYRDSQVEENRAQAAAARAKPGETERRLDQTDRRLDITDAYNQGRLAGQKETAEERARHNKVGEEDRDEDRAARTAVAENNLKYRKQNDAANRTQRDAQFKSRLAETVRARIATEAARKVTQGQRAAAIRISAAKAKAWAESVGADWNDFVDALDANDVLIDPDKK